MIGEERGIIRKGDQVDLHLPHEDLKMAEDSHVRLPSWVTMTLVDSKAELYSESALRLISPKRPSKWKEKIVAIKLSCFSYWAETKM